MRNIHKYVDEILLSDHNKIDGLDVEACFPVHGFPIGFDLSCFEFNEIWPEKFVEFHPGGSPATGGHTLEPFPDFFSRLNMILVEKSNIPAG